MPRFQSLSEVEDYIFYHLSHYSIEGDSAYRPGLDNTISLLDRLGNPQQDFDAVHVGGTNGKGSTTHLMAAAFIQRGLRVGTYTSPHITTYRERIRVQGQFVEESFVLDFANQHWELIEELRPSFFEFTVAMAFAYFRYKKVDIAVVEVGLGGTYDSTNVLQPQLSIITNVGLDHQNTLGHTLPEIAANKAGIIKPYTPVVIGEYDEQTFPVFEKYAHQNESTLYLAPDLYKLQRYELRPEGMLITYQHAGTELRIETDLRGAYQTHNIATALTACDALKPQYEGLRQDFIQSAQHINTLMPIYGRWQSVESEPEVILDVCHNTHGVRQALRQLEHEHYAELYIILGLSADKQATQILSLLPRDAHIIVTQADTRRALPVDELYELAREVSADVTAAPSLEVALHQARERASDDDLILVLGSCYLVGEYFV